MPLWRGCARCSTRRGWAARVCVLGGISAAVHRLLRGSVVGAGDCVAGRGFSEPAGFPGPGRDRGAADHSTLSRTRRLIDVETHVAVFTWVLERLAGGGLVQGKTVGVDATTLEANAAMRSIERRIPGIVRGVRGVSWRRHRGLRRRRERSWRGLTGPGRTGDVEQGVAVSAGHGREDRKDEGRRTHLATRRSTGSTWRRAPSSR